MDKLIDKFAFNVARLQNTNAEVSHRLAAEKSALLGSIGVAKEAGELLDILYRYTVYGKPLDVAHVREELGDTLFYITQIANSMGLTLDECMRANIEKLEKRYPGGFSEKAALERADKNEGEE